MRTEEKGLEVDKYWTTACEHCPVKSSCTTGEFRRVSRWQSEELVEDMLIRLDTEPDRMKKRRQTVEHPFGTIKLWMGYTHFQMRRLENVSTEMSFHVLAYNIMGVTALVEAIMGWMAIIVSIIATFSFIRANLALQTTYKYFFVKITKQNTFDKSFDKTRMRARNNAFPQYFEFSHSLGRMLPVIWNIATINRT